MIPEDIQNYEAKNELNKIKQKKLLTGKKIIYRASEYPYSFKNFETIKTSGSDIYNDKTTLKKLMKIKEVYQLKS